MNHCNSAVRCQISLKCGRLSQFCPHSIPRDQNGEQLHGGTQGLSWQCCDICNLFELCVGLSYAYTHRRRSDWNSRGTHGGTYYKSLAVEAKNTFSYIVMQVIWCLKLCNMTKSGETILAPNSGGLVPLVPPVICAHAYTVLLCV